jgi:TrmH family RNA methyltransferase
VVLPIFGGHRASGTRSAKYIRALSNASELRAVRALHAKKEREAQRRFLVQGPKLVGELLASGWPVHALHGTADMAARFAGEQLRVWTEAEMDRMGTLESGNSIIAVAAMPARGPLAPLGPEESVLALDGIGDPGNLGTLLRIADWFGIRRILVSRHTVEEFNPKCVQSSMGSLFRVAVHRTDLPAELARLRDDGAHLYLASMEGTVAFDVQLRWPSVLILGSESHGPAPAVRALGATTIAVPRIGSAESLNVAMAASALCMESARQARTR